MTLDWIAQFKLSMLSELVLWNDVQYWLNQGWVPPGYTQAECGSASPPRGTRDVAAVRDRCRPDVPAHVDPRCRRGASSAYLLSSTNLVSTGAHLGGHVLTGRDRLVPRRTLRALARWQAG